MQPGFRLFPNRRIALPPTSRCSKRHHVSHQREEFAPNLPTCPSDPPTSCVGGATHCQSMHEYESDPHAVRFRRPKPEDRLSRGFFEIANEVPEQAMRPKRIYL